MPSQPGTMTFSGPFCGPTVVTCSVAPVSNATNYVWAVSGSVATITSGQGTRTITLNIPAGFTNAQLSVAASNCLGSSATRTQTITGLASQSQALTGPLYICPNTTQNYSVASVFGVTSYSWTITGNASILSSSGSSCVVKTNGNWTGGVLTCNTINACGSNPRNYTLNKGPLQPGGITGPAFNVCPVAGVSTASYSIAPVTGATSYTWTVATEMTITSNTGTAITVSISSAFAGGNVSVTANNSCGVSLARTLVVSTRSAVPGAISGPASVCKSQTGVAYGIAAVTGATGYTWSVSGGATIAPSGVNATVNYPSSTGTSATIAVNSVNQCGASNPQRLVVSINTTCRDAQVGDIQALSAFPNPTNGRVTMSFTAPVAERYLVRIVDLIGKEIYSGDLNAEAGLNTKEFDLTSVSKGIYLLNVRTVGGDSQTMRIIVE
ncbi:MAG: T9SS type A sorting domain-containing protein [Bacteroidota bacterium]